MRGLLFAIRYSLFAIRFSPPQRQLLPGVVALFDQPADMVDPHALAVFEMIVAATKLARRRQARELGFELGDDGAQPLDIGPQHVPFEEQLRQVLLRQIDNLVHFDTNSLTREKLHEKGRTIQRDAASRSRLAGECVDLAKRPGKV